MGTFKIKVGTDTHELEAPEGLPKWVTKKAVREAVLAATRHGKQTRLGTTTMWVQAMALSKAIHCGFAGGVFPNASKPHKNKINDMVASGLYTKEVVEGKACPATKEKGKLWKLAYVK